MTTIPWPTLAAQLHGDLILPDTTTIYDLARRPFNARIDQRPAAIARVISEADVSACIRFCNEHDVSITCRSGGHSSEGYSARDDELMIDLSAMQRIDLDVRGAGIHVSAGCTSGQVDLATFPYGFAVPSGDCTGVGIAGLTMGGGHGPLARSFGLTIDSVLEARIVTARSEGVLVVDHEREPDLFWALRGGGGGNFGVVTQFTYRLHDVGRQFAAGNLSYDWGTDTRKVFQFYRDWMRSVDADPRLTLSPMVAQEPDGSPSGSLSVFYNGDFTAGVQYLESIMQAAGVPLPSGTPPHTSLGDALRQNLGPMTLPGYVGSESTTAWLGTGQFWRSGFLDNDFDDDAIDTMMGFLERAPKVTHGINQTFGFIESFGGRIASVGATDTAFFWRDKLFSFTFIGVYPAEQADLAARTEQWADEFRAAMEPHLSGAVYVNYVQGNLRHWHRAYYGGNFERLRAIKQAYDPDHRFAFPQDLSQPDDF